MAKMPFMAVPGSDPSAVMKGDIPQHVRGSTAPGTKAKRPRPVKNFSLRRERRRSEAAEERGEPKKGHAREERMEHK